MAKLKLEVIMKVRHGFVSNSSSSSFVVSVPKNSGPLTLKINIERECEVISTLEELDNSRHFRYYDVEEKANSAEYQQCVESIKAGNIIKIFVASNEDSDNMLSGFYGHRLKTTDIEGEATIITDGQW